MLNLRAIANSATSAINPNISGQLRASIGYAQQPNFERVPAYAAAVPIILQAQALSKKEIEHLDKLNISDATRAVYANRQLTGVDRENQSGGDLLDFTDPETGKPSTWLVVAVLEGWGTSGWCKAALARQLT